MTLDAKLEKKRLEVMELYNTFRKLNEKNNYMFIDDYGTAIEFTNSLEFLGELEYSLKENIMIMAGE